MAELLRGVFPVLATPFDAMGAIDEASLVRLVAYTLASGAQGLTVGGLASEVYKLADEERRRIVELVLREVRGRAPVWVGTGHQCIELCVAHSRHAEQHGAAGVMVMPPYAVKPSLAQVRAFFTALDDQVQVPIMIQDAPLFSGVHLPTELMAALAQATRHVRSVKVEAPPTGPKISDLLAKASGALAVVGGMGGQNLVDELKRGAAGTLPGSAIPEIHVAIEARFRGGRVAAAEELHRRIMPLLRFCQQSIEFSLHAYKRILVHRGVIASAHVRQPSATFDAGEQAELDELIRLIA